VGERTKNLWEVLSSCGWQGAQTEEYYEAMMRSTPYLSWWADKPREIVKMLRAKLKRIPVGSRSEGQILL
jgi:hypothetical protein